MKDEIQKRKMEFYPMVPFILLVLACLFKLPNFLWTAFQVSRASALVLRNAKVPFRLVP